MTDQPALQNCTEIPGSHRAINLCEYSFDDIFFVLGGTILWVIAYVIIARNGFKYKFVEMPVMAASANIAWEFVWGFLYRTDMGEVFVWGLRAWFFFDLFIFSLVLLYGDKQLLVNMLRPFFKPAVILVTLTWGLLFYFFVGEDDDTSMGSTSAFLINILMSVLYLTTFLSGNNPAGYSYAVAWLKMLGTGIMTVYLFYHFPGEYYPQTMGVICFVVDCIYICCVGRYRNGRLTFGPALAQTSVS